MKISKKIAAMTLSIATLFYSIFSINAVLPDSERALATEKRLLPIYSVKRGDKLVGLSFDAAWGADKTEKILDVLRENNVKATFFLVAFWAEKYPELVRRIAAEGHEIGTHSATHPHFNKLSYLQAKDELLRSVEVIEGITGQKVRLFRPPFGEYDNKLISLCEELGLIAIQWDVDSLDWKGLSANEIFERVTKRTKSGSIILCHNNADNIVEGLKRFLPALKEKGFELTSISEVLLEGKYTIDSSGAQVPA